MRDELFKIASSRPRSHIQGRNFLPMYLRFGGFATTITTSLTM
jgi:hypothetical protein